MRSNTEPLALSPAAAAIYMAVSKRQIYVLLAAGSLRARKLGRATLVETASIREYFEALPAHESGAALFPDKAVRS